VRLREVRAGRGREANGDRHEIGQRR
jgi:hypothetical protein